LDHPPAHIHAVHAGREAKIEIDPVVVRYSYLEPSEERLVLRWLPRHREQLLEAWENAQQGRTPTRISEET
jgi:hypothetical protein